MSSSGKEKLTFQKRKDFENTKREKNKTKTKTTQLTGTCRRHGGSLGLELLLHGPRRVALHVLAEIALLGEELAAEPADVGGRLAVGVGVGLQLQLGAEGVAAGQAGEPPLPLPPAAVGGHVRLQLRSWRHTREKDHADQCLAN